MRGEGSFYKRKSDGLWVGAVKHNGRTRTVSSKNRDVAKTQWRDLKKRLGVGVDPGRRTLADLANEWLDWKQPIYLNLAPSYDATLTPRLMTDRGVQLGGVRPEWRVIVARSGEEQRSPSH